MGLCRARAANLRGLGSAPKCLCQVAGQSLTRVFHHPWLSLYDHARFPVGLYGRNSHGPLVLGLLGVKCFLIKSSEQRLAPRAPVYGFVRSTRSSLSLALGFPGLVTSETQKALCPWPLVLPCLVWAVAAVAASPTETSRLKVHTSPADPPHWGRTLPTGAAPTPGSSSHAHTTPAPADPPHWGFWGRTPPPTLVLIPGSHTGPRPRSSLPACCRPCGGGIAPQVSRREVRYALPAPAPPFPELRCFCGHRQQ